MKVLISGCHAGPNPSPGLGVARSLREAYPAAVLIAKDHSIQSSGLHHEVFDDIWLNRPWDEMDLHSHRDQICEELAGGTWMFSGHDLEARWLSMDRPARALVPPAIAFNAIAKPHFPAADALPARIPASIPLTEGDRRVHSFCRHHDWNVWVKGPSYEARRVRDWQQLRQARSELGSVWTPDGLFLQAGIDGWEVSVVFAALDGELLGAHLMEKRQITDEGKTWAGAIEDLPEAFRACLQRIVSDLRWTGGGELEFVRDLSGTLWLIDWNPRFPAWIYGLTLGGHNLPALVLAAASGDSPQACTSQGQQFIRVVVEVPVRKGYALPAPPPLRLNRVAPAKHPSGMPLLIRRLQTKDAPRQQMRPPQMPEPMINDLRDGAHAVISTPRRLMLRRTALRQFASMARAAAMLNRPPIHFRVAYSIKTNPSPDLLTLAHDHGFFAEVISRAELETCLKQGFKYSDIIFNGPVPATTALRDQQVRTVFADSLEAYHDASRARVAPVVGVRLRPPFVESRFGVHLERADVFRRLVDTVCTSPSDIQFGLSFHVQSSDVGVARWTQIARSVIHFGSAIQRLANRVVHTLDLGGGCAPDDAGLVMNQVMPSIISDVHRALPSVREIIIEPGKALAEPCFAVMASILEVRAEPMGGRTAVIDASVAELPMLNTYPHRIAIWSDDVLLPLSRGTDRVLGRLCIESDIIAEHIRLPIGIRAGDRVFICDAGSYDGSMGYYFGIGRLTESRRLRTSEALLCMPAEDVYVR